MARRYQYYGPAPTTLTGNMRQEVTSAAFLQSNNSTVALGGGVLLDIEKAPHVLIAGTTGSGKSVMMHNILASLILKNSPETAQVLIIDPKMVEFEFFYKNHPMLWQPVCTDPEQSYATLNAAADEMMRRYDENRQTGQRFWTGAKLYIIIDEVADLIDTCGKKVEKVISKIARLGRGAGVHLIVATQHPTAQVLSRQITANLDTRIALRVRDKAASRLVLGANGAELLKGKGDALLYTNGQTTHFQGGYISDEELERFAHAYSLRQLQEPKVHHIDLNQPLASGRTAEQKKQKRSFFSLFR